MAAAFLLGCCAALHVRIATRASPLAVAQAEAVAAALRRADAAVTTELVRVSASGDQPSAATTQTAPLAMAPPDFTSAVDEAILSGQADVAVHSLKDLPPIGRWKAAGRLTIRCHLPRGNPLDVLIGPAESLEALPAGARVGSASVRRQAQLLWARPDVRPVNLRGNVQARLDALQPRPLAFQPCTAGAPSETAPGQSSLVGVMASAHSGPADIGQIDALILAQAGLERLGVHNAPAPVHTASLQLPSVHAAALDATAIVPAAPPALAATPGCVHPQHLLSADAMLPAACQGIVGAACRADDPRLLQLLGRADDFESRLAAAAESAFLDETDGAAPWAGRPPVAALMQRARVGVDNAGGEHGAACCGSGAEEEGRGEKADKGDGLKGESECHGDCVGACAQDAAEVWEFRALIATPDGRRLIRSRERAPANCTEEQASQLGRRVAAALLHEAGPDFFAGCEAMSQA